MKSLDILSLTFLYKNVPMKNFTQLWLKVIKNQVTYSLIQNLLISLWMLYMFEWTIKEKAKRQHHRTHLLYKWLHPTHLSCKDDTILREKNSIIVNIFCLRLGAAIICWWYLSGPWERPEYHLMAHFQQLPVSWCINWSDLGTKSSRGNASIRGGWLNLFYHEHKM